jgi:uncharacterized protein (TIGR02147 family)
MNNNFSVFLHQEAAGLLRSYIMTLPQKGRGMVKAISEHLHIASPQVSQFLSGVKTITVDQAYQLGVFFSWSELEMEYWLCLVEMERANHHESKKYFRKKLERIQKSSLQISNAVGPATELSDQDKGQFYGSWIYSALRMFCSIGEGKSIQEIYEAFPEFDTVELAQVIEFLMQRRLLKKMGSRYEMGEQRTFVAKGSSFLKQHTTNWRLRAIDRVQFITDDELLFTAPLSISEAGFKKVRRELQAYIKNLSENLSSYGDAEKVVCLNIDFFVAAGERKKK